MPRKRMRKQKECGDQMNAETKRKKTKRKKYKKKRRLFKEKRRLFKEKNTTRNTTNEV